MKAPMNTRLRRTPTQHRSLIGFVCFLLLAVAKPASGEVLREGDVIRLARQHNPQAAALSNSVGLAKAQQKAASLRSAPSLSWQRQTQASVETEDSVAISLPVNRSQSQRVAAKLARAQVALARSSEYLGGASAARQALEAFYLSLAQRERARIAEEAVKQLEEASRIVRRRREEGRLSGYDVARIELALEAARSQAREANAHVASTRAELARRIGTRAEEMKLRGQLLPPADQREVQQDATRGESPALAALRSAAGLAGVAHKEARGTWLPVVSLTGGVRVVTEESADLGYVAGVSLNLPFWTGATALRRTTRAREQSLTSKAMALQGQRAIRTASATETFRLLAAEARRYATVTQTPVAALTKAASAGYREGERTLLELIDANRAEMQVRRRVLELELAARLAELAMRDAHGDFEL